MRTKHESSSLNAREWTLVTVQSPLGAVMLARRLPVISKRDTRANGEVPINRRFASSNPLDPVTKRVRSRR
jgi:hypothetical protein